MADLWNKIKNVVGISAPVLGNAIVPGIGGAAGSLIAKALGCEPKPEAIETAISKDPQAALKLKELETKHSEFLISAAHENDKMYLTDVQSARQREIEVTRSTGKINWPMYLIALVIFLGFFIVLGLLFKIPLIMANKDIIVYTVGGLQTAFITVVAYFFGSSKGSSEKNDILSKTATKGDTK